MDAKNIIQKGTLAKYLMVFDDKGLFDPSSMDFSLELVYGYRHTTKVLQFQSTPPHEGRPSS